MQIYYCIHPIRCWILKSLLSFLWMICRSLRALRKTYRSQKKKHRVKKSSGTKISKNRRNKSLYDSYFRPDTLKKITPIITIIHIFILNYHYSLSSKPLCKSLIGKQAIYRARPSEDSHPARASKNIERFTPIKSSKPRDIFTNRRLIEKSIIS